MTTKKQGTALYLILYYIVRALYFASRFSIAIFLGFLILILLLGAQTITIENARWLALAILAYFPLRYIKEYMEKSLDLS